MKPWIVDDTQENGRWAWADENDVVMLAKQATDSDTSPLGDVRRACKQLELG